MIELCNHGFYLDDCALCLKRPGECDYGSCTDVATTSEHNRPCCDRHAPVLRNLATGKTS